MANISASSRLYGERVGEGSEGDPPEPSGNDAETSFAAWIASLVFPIPPGPAIVSSRVAGSPRRSVTSASSGLRPMKGVVGVGKVRGRDRLELRERPIAELVEPLRHRDILEMVFAEVDERSIVDRRCGRRRHQHLPSVTHGGDPGRPVHVDTDVALVRRERGPRVDPDPHPDRAGLQCLARGAGRVDRPGGRRERHEERVPLGVDLDASVASEGLTEKTTVLPEDLGVRRVPELVEELRRSLDVREQERDGAGGQVPSGHDAREHTLAEPAGLTCRPLRGTMSAWG